MKKAGKEMEMRSVVDDNGSLLVASRLTSGDVRREFHYSSEVMEQEIHHFS